MSGGPGERAPIEVLVERDLHYGGLAGTSASRRLDVYWTPVRPGGGLRMTLVLVHGGAWVSGDKADMGHESGIARWLAAAGHVVVVPNFHLARSHGEATDDIDRSLEDLARCLRWAGVNARKYVAQGKRCALVGYSSGAHLVSLLALDARHLQRQGLSPKLVESVVCIDGAQYDLPFLFGLMRARAWRPEEVKKLRFLASLFGTTKARQLLFSPAHYVGTSTAPRFLVISTGSQDGVRRIASARFVDQLTQAGGRVREHHVEHCTHEEAMVRFAQTELPQVIIDFLRAGTATG